MIYRFVVIIQPTSEARETLSALSQKYNTSGAQVIYRIVVIIQGVGRKHPRKGLKWKYFLRSKKIGTESPVLRPRGGRKMRPNQQPPASVNRRLDGY